MLQVVSDVLRRRRARGWLVGGSVRDRESGRPSPDIDLVVAAEPGAVAKDIADALGAPWFALSERHGAYRVMGPQGHVDVAALRGADIVDDLAQRDFTVNAMAVPLSGGALVDPFGGLAHLRTARLVAVSDHIFADDPLRLMRAARFAHVLGLRLGDSLADAVKTQAPLVARAAPERVTTEMVLTLGAGRAAQAVRLWDDLGLLAVVFPEVVSGDRLPNALGLLERLDQLLVRPEIWFPAGAGVLADRLASPVDGAVSRPVALRLAALLHPLSVGEAETVVRRLKLSGEMLSLTKAVCRHSTPQRGSKRPDEGRGYHGGRQARDAAQSRADILFLWGVAPWEPEVIILEGAAAASKTTAGAAAGAEAGIDAGSEGGQALEPALRRARRLMALWAERTTRGVSRPPLDGDLLMRELGLTPGPGLGEVLREVRLAWEAGEAVTYEQLLTIARTSLETV